MAAAEVVVLSSDDEPGPFVTPHPARTARSISRRPTTTTIASAEIGAESSARAAVSVAATPDASGPTRGNPSRPHRFGFLDLSSDDLSSPFPSFSARKLLRDKPRSSPISDEADGGKGGSGGVVMPSDVDDTHDGGALNPGLGHGQVDEELDEEETGSEARPSKRLRLSPQPGRDIPSAATVVEIVDIEDGLFWHSSPTVPRCISPSSAQQRPLHLTDATKANEPIPPPCPRHEVSAPAVVECIDLMSSSSSEFDHTESTNDTTDTSMTLKDSLDLEIISAPAVPEVQKQTEPGHGKESSVEIMFLSSSPLTLQPTRNRTSAVQGSALDGGSISGAALRRGVCDGPSVHREPLRSVRSRPLRRSLSEGHRLSFLDDDEDDDMGSSPSFQNINNLLAAWRGNEEPDPEPARRPANSTARRETAPEIRRSNTATKEQKTRKSTTTATDAEKESRRKEREVGREQRRHEKEAEKEKKQQEREVEKERRRMAREIAKEKKAEEKATAAAFNEANKSRTDKSVAMPEIIVQLPTTLPQATKEVAETMLSETKAEFETWTSPVDNVVTWRRKVTSEYKADLGHWVPVPLRVEQVKHALVMLRAEDLVQRILAGDARGGGEEEEEEEESSTDGLGSHVRTMRQHFPDYVVVYLIEGLTAWKSKNRTIRNRQFADAVRSAGAGGAAGEERADRSRAAGQPRRAGRAGRTAAQKQQYVDEAVVDDALLELQVEHEVMIHETTALDTARWIRIFTEQIATAPYRQQKDQLYAAAASFCMDTGQIPTGDGAAETYSLMLQQIGRVTEPVALGVAARFDSVPKLVRGFAQEGPLALEACLKSRNRNGALSDRTVGPALSRRIYKVFMGQDENM